MKARLSKKLFKPVVVYRKDYGVGTFAGVPEKYICPNCHKEIGVYEMFCHNCGQGINWDRQDRI